MFLDSANRSYGTHDDATFQIDSDLIRCYGSEHMRVKLQDWVMRNAYYDVAKNLNDQFLVQPSNPQTPLIAPNSGFYVTYGSPDVYIVDARVTIPGKGYMTNNQVASQIQTALTNKFSGSSWTVRYQNWSNPSSTSGKKFGIVCNTPNTNFTLRFTSDDGLRVVMGFTQFQYPQGGGAASNAYYAESTNLSDELIPSTYITLPQGFYDSDRLQTVLSNTYPFSGGNPPGDSAVTTDPWTVTTDNVSNTVSLVAPSTFPTTMLLKFTDFYLPTNLTTNTLLGFGQTSYGPATTFTSDQETQLTRVSNLVIHTNIPPKRANQVLDNYSSLGDIDTMPFMKQSNILARLPVDVPQGALLSYRDLNNDFSYPVGPDRLQSVRIYLTDQFNQSIPMTADVQFNCVLKFEYVSD